MSAPGRLLVVSNRLPVAFERHRDGSWSAQRGSGGLITALLPVLERRGGVWIGWPGVVQEESAGFAEALASTQVADFDLRPVLLSASQRDLYYHGFANEILWPLFHDLQTRCTFDPSYWQAYREVNRRFAEEVAKVAGRRDLIWIHDYHLMGVAAELAALGVRRPTAFFLHTPFPPPDIFAKLPWSREFLTYLLAHDLIGFQVPRDRRNFVTCLRSLLPEARARRRRGIHTVQWQGREVRMRSFPISIDARGFTAAAARSETAAAAAAIRQEMNHVFLLLGVDRLDYTKGVPFKLEAVRHLFRRHPELRRRVSLVQILSPSREVIPEYLRLKAEVEQLVGQINGELGEPGWMPIHYLHRLFGRDDLVAYYRAADACLATPLKDGMNLVAKEYCAAKVDRDGVLILSEFAGAAHQLHQGALLVNPYDIVALAERIAEAFAMPEPERRTRMMRLQRVIREADVFHWVDSFLAACPKS